MVTAIHTPGGQRLQEGVPPGGPPESCRWATARSPPIAAVGGDGRHRPRCAGRSARPASGCGGHRGLIWPTPSTVRLVPVWTMRGWRTRRCTAFGAKVGRGPSLERPRFPSPAVVKAQADADREFPALPVPEPRGDRARWTSSSTKRPAWAPTSAWPTTPTPTAWRRDRHPRIVHTGHGDARWRLWAR